MCFLTLKKKKAVTTVSRGNVVSLRHQTYKKMIARDVISVFFSRLRRWWWLAESIYMLMLTTTTVKWMALLCGVERPPTQKPSKGKKKTTQNVGKVWKWIRKWKKKTSFSFLEDKKKENGGRMAPPPPHIEWVTSRDVAPFFFPPFFLLFLPPELF